MRLKYNTSREILVGQVGKRDQNWEKNSQKMGVFNLIFGEKNFFSRIYLSLILLLTDLGNVLSYKSA